ncbi:MAG: peptide deformylase [Lachnospiraceae bacterium]|nr:peptide deformylase [Lachnospiraceae bacterium]
MVKEIVKDIFFLGQKSLEANVEDKQIIIDLKDTLVANRERCVGMAANMIGYKKRIIIVNMGFVNMIMVNPVITKKKMPYDTEEGCLSLTGVRKTTRYKEIEVSYQDEHFRQTKQVFKDYIAQIVQHECDHLEGIII